MYGWEECLLILQGPLTFPGPRISFEPHTGYGPPAQRGHSQHTSSRKGKPGVASSRKSQAPIERQAPTAQPQLGQEVLLGGREDEPRAKVKGQASHPFFTPDCRGSHEPWRSNPGQSMPQAGERPNGHLQPAPREG